MFVCRRSSLLLLQLQRAAAAAAAIEPCIKAGCATFASASASGFGVGGGAAPALVSSASRADCQQASGSHVAASLTAQQQQQQQQPRAATVSTQASPSAGGMPQQRQQKQQQPLSLDGRLKRGRSCQEVLQLVQSAGHRCTMYHLTSAATTMGTLHRRSKQQRHTSGSTAGGLEADRQAFRSLVEFAFQQLPTFSSTACAQFLWAAAALGAPFSREQQAAWEQQAISQLPHAEPRHVSKMLWAFATLGGRQRPSSSMQAALQPGLLLVLAHDDAAAVASSLWGWAKLGWPIDEQLAAAAGAALQRVAADMEPRSLPMALYAFSNIGRQPGADSLAALRSVLLRTLDSPQTTPDLLASCLWGWVLLGQRLDRQLTAAAQQAVQRAAADMSPPDVLLTVSAFGTGGWQLGPDLAKQLRGELSRALRSPGKDAESVAFGLRGWAKLGQPLPLPLAAAAGAAVQRVAPGMAPRDVANTVGAYARGGWRLDCGAQPELHAALLRALRSPACQPNQVARALWGWQKLGQPLEGELAQAAGAAVQRLAGAMRPEELSDLLWAIARSDWQLGDSFLDALQQALLAALQSPDASPQVLADGLHGWAKLGRPASPELAAAADAAVQRAAGSMWPGELSIAITAGASGAWQLSVEALAALRQALLRMLCWTDAAPHAVAMSLLGWAQMRQPLDLELASAAVTALRRAMPEMQAADVQRVRQAFESDGWRRWLDEAATEGSAAS